MREKSGSPDRDHESGSRLLRLQILVVDDDEGCLRSVESLLAGDGHRIFTATGGLAALEFARRLKLDRQSLDLSILDFNMPDLTGLETYRRLREELPGMEAIFISGDPSSSLEQMVRRAGGFALVRKPLDVSSMREAVRDLVRRDGVN